MHDEMITLFDDCIAGLVLLREQLAATRRVEPGERYTTVLAAIAAAERFARHADQTLTPVRESEAAVSSVPPRVPPVPQPVLSATLAVPAAFAAGASARPQDWAVARSSTSSAGQRLR